MCLVLLVLKFTDEGLLSEINLNKILQKTGRFLNHRLFIFVTTDAGKKSLVKPIDLCPGPICELFINTN